MNGSNQNFLSGNPSDLLEQKVDTLQKKLQVEYIQFKNDLYENPGLFMESPHTAYSMMRVYDFLKEGLHEDKFAQEFIDVLLDKENILSLASIKWIEAANNYMFAVEEFFQDNFERALTVEHNRKTITAFYKEKDNIDHRTKTLVNRYISDMSSNHCKTYVECLRCLEDLNPIIVTDIAETMEEFFLDEPTEILSKTDEIVQSQKRYFIAAPTNCITDSNQLNYENQILIVDPVQLKSDFRKIGYQLFYAEGGAGCSPDARGSSIFGKNIYTDERERWMRGDFLGIADISSLPENVQGTVRCYLENIQAEETELEV